MKKGWDTKAWSTEKETKGSVDGMEKKSIDRRRDADKKQGGWHEGQKH